MTSTLTPEQAASVIRGFKKARINIDCTVADYQEFEVEDQEPMLRAWVKWSAASDQYQDLVVEIDNSPKKGFRIEMEIPEELVRNREYAWLLTPTTTDRYHVDGGVSFIFSSLENAQRYKNAQGATHLKPKAVEVLTTIPWTVAVPPTAMILRDRDLEMVVGIVDPDDTGHVVPVNPMLAEHTQGLALYHVDARTDGMGQVQLGPNTVLAGSPGNCSATLSSVNSPSHTGKMQAGKPWSGAGHCFATSPVVAEHRIKKYLEECMDQIQDRSN